MFDAIGKLGQYIIENEGLSEEAIFIEKSKMLGARLISAVFQVEDKRANYNKIVIREGKSSDAARYLYRTFRHGRYDLTPTTRFTSLESLRKRTVLWFEKYAEEYEDWLLHALRNEMVRKGAKIFADVSKEYNELDRESRSNLLFTIELEEYGKAKLLGDYEIFRNIFKNESRKTFFDKYNVESKGVAPCYLCGRTREVYGFASPFSFYTFDKPGFAPDFKVEEAWKRAAVCAECATSLGAGKQFLDEYLLKNFYGFKFYVIPKFVFEDVNPEVINTIKDADKRNYAESLLGEEEDILNLMKEEETVFGLTFMFIAPKQKDFFDVVKYVEDVPPSWINRIYTALKGIESLPIVQEPALKKILGEKHVGKLGHFELGGLIRPFFPRPHYDKYFINVTGDILAQKEVNKDLLLRAFMEMIRDSHVNNKAKTEKILCLKSLILLALLHELESIKNLPGESGRRLSRKVQNVNAFFEQHKMAFDTPDKKATFLVGVLTKLLLDVQYATRRSTPFRSKLHSLKLNERRLKKIFPETVEKLMEYDRPYPRMQECVSEALVEAENWGWKLTNDEISYYFALGVNLGGIFK